MSKKSFLVWMASLALVGYGCVTLYHYFFDKVEPVIRLSGIEENGWYGGEVACVVTGEHPYKVKNISIFIDNKPLVYNFQVGKSFFEYPYAIPTKTLSNQRHVLEIRAIDGTFHRLQTVQRYSFVVDNTPLQVAFIRQAGEFRVFQGKTLHIQFQASKPLKKGVVRVFSKTFPCFAEADSSLIYEAFIPVECEMKPNEYMIAIDCYDNVDNIVTLEGKVQVIPYPFKKGQVTVDAGKMEEEKTISASQDLLNQQLEQLAQQSPQKKLWTGSFCVPTEVGRIFTEFGSIRVTKEKGMYAHKGVDIGHLPRSSVWACQNGVVIIKDRYHFSGNTVVIDHGWGILSLYFHLDSFADSLVLGASIKKGAPLGTVGKTGYAAGYHLHWELRINDIAVDPMEWVSVGF